MTPLELVFAIEGTTRLISTVVLAGRFAFDAELSGFLRDSYPELEWFAAETN